MDRILKTSEECNGCTACKSICPVNAISMQVDAEGFKIPVIDEEKCINCNMCIKVCPTEKIIADKKYNEIIRGFAVKNKNETVKYNSASGALFPAFAKWFIENNGYVCGCILDDNLFPCHIISDKWEDIERMQDSKYVQSDMMDNFTEILKLLKHGKRVLFTGTSCQVSGLKSFLQNKNINDENLLTIDFFCHGVPSPLIFKEYLKFYEKEKSRKIIGYRFRSKKYGWGRMSRGSSHLNCIQFRWGKKIFSDNISLLARSWRTIFFSNLTLRKYCERCPYTTPYKPADITMGDFWGIYNINKDFDDGKGVSVLITHNDKAETFLSDVRNQFEICNMNIKDIIKRQANAFSPSEVDDKKREQFWNDYRTNGFKYCMSKYFYYDNKTRIKGIIKRILFALHLRDIY